MLRQSTIDDYAPFVYLMRQVHEIHYKGNPSFYKNEMDTFDKNTFIQEMHHDNIYIYEEKKIIIGFAYFNIMTIQNNPAIQDRSFMYLIDICIEQTLRHKGYGVKIMNELQSIAKTKNCKEIILDVYTFNIPALRFYRKMGFKDEKIGMKYIL